MGIMEAQNGHQMSIEQRIRAKMQPDQDLVPEDYENLILDDDIILNLSAEDKTFLEKFSNLQRLSMNVTKLKSLSNLPKSKIIKLELSDNQIPGSELAKLVELYADDLTVLKVCNNKIEKFEEVKILAGLKSLLKLDLTGNKVYDEEGYTKKVF